MLSILIPAYNEARTIEPVLQRVLALQMRVPFEVIVVDDGSKDGTSDAVRRIAAIDARVRPVRLEPNGGKGAAIRHAASLALGDVLVMQDADLELDPGELPKLLEPILAGQADVVYGSRFLGRRFEWSMSDLANWFLTALTNVLFLSRLTDMETAYKMMKTSIYRDLKLGGRRFEIEPELTAKLIRCGHRIHEVPIGYVRRTVSDGKKIGWRDGVSAIHMLVRCRVMRASSLRQAPVGPRQSLAS